MIADQFSWVLDHLQPPRSVGPSSVMLMGDDPVSCDAWRDKLFALGRHVFFPDQRLATLLVGRRNWSQEVIRELLWARRGLAVRIVSQEMMFAWLATRVNPLDDPARARVVWGDHPVYRFLDDEGGFDWPTLTVPDSFNDDPDGGDLPPSFGWGDGLLSAAGYRVGGDAKYAPVRRQALRAAYMSNDALDHLPAEKRGAYGMARSWRRLESIAQAIARQYRLAANHPHDRRLAMRHWEQDFLWLRAEFYGNEHVAQEVFDWPTLGG